MNDISEEVSENRSKILAQVMREASASPAQCSCDSCADDILAMRDISVEEREELPKILGPIADDAPAVALGGASALEQAPVDRELLITAIEAASHNLARLKVRRRSGE